MLEKSFPFIWLPAHEGEKKNKGYLKSLLFSGSVMFFSPGFLDQNLKLIRVIMALLSAVEGRG